MGVLLLFLSKYNSRTLLIGTLPAEKMILLKFSTKRNVHVLVLREVQKKKLLSSKGGKLGTTGKVGHLPFIAVPTVLKKN